MNVVVWARVSSTEQMEGYSVDAQLRAMRDKAAKNGWTIAREFVVAESAKRGAGRAVFNQMFNWVKGHAKRENVKAILSHKLDRVCRNMRDAVRLQELEELCSVQLAFVENQFAPGAAGQLSFNVMAAVAQYYSDNLRTEVLKGMDERVRQGWPTGHAPFGYINTDDREEPVKPHPEKAATVARIFELYSSGLYTFKEVSDKLQREGHTFRKSEPRFARTSLSYLLKNRFYVGEIEHHGTFYPGKHKVFIDRDVFNACQNTLKGKNRRTGNPDIMLSGGVLRCAVCGYGVCGEQTRRKLTDGGCNVHTYYKCSNNHASEDHPKVRWRQDVVESAILRELDTIRISDAETADWMRHALGETFDNASKMRDQRRAFLVKRKSELTNMKDRLLNAFLAGTIDEQTFRTKTADLKRDLDDVDRNMEEAGNANATGGDTALSVFDFSQNIVGIWRGSNFRGRREILECVSSNVALSDVSLMVAKRKPFDFLAERPLLENGEGSGTRTHDLRLKKPLLYQLSYTPV